MDRRTTGVDVTHHTVTGRSLHPDAASAVMAISSCALSSPGRVMRPQPRPTSAASRNGRTCTRCLARIAKLKIAEKAMTNPTVYSVMKSMYG